MEFAISKRSIDTEFGEYVFSNGLTIFEALSNLEVVSLGNQLIVVQNEINTLSNQLIVVQNELNQTRSELNDLSVSLDVLTVRVNTQGFRIEDNTADIGTLANQMVEVVNLANDAATAAARAQLTATNANSTANEAQSVAVTAQNTAVLAQAQANSANVTANIASTAANAASAAAGDAQNTAVAAQVQAAGATVVANSAATTASQALALGNQIFAKQNSIIYGWGVMNNTNTLFQMQSNLTSDSVMMTQQNFTSALRLGNGAVLPYTQFWIRSAGEFGQPNWPAARVRTGAWILLLTGGSGSAQQMTIDPFYIRDYT